MVLLGLTATAVAQNRTTRFSEHLIKDGYAYSFGIAAGDLNGDGHIDLTSADALPHNRLYWFENDGKGNFTQHVIEKNYPERLERHAIGDINGDGRPDVVIIENLRGDVLWYENIGKPGNGTQSKKHIVADAFDHAFEAVAADLNGDGRVDVAATAWGPGGRVVWFENLGDPRGKWKTHELKTNWSRANQIIIADFNGDGRPDLAAGAERGANEIRWWRNEGSK